MLMSGLRMPWLLAASAVLVLVRTPVVTAAAAEELPAAVARVLETAGPVLAPSGRPVEAEPLRAFYQQRENRPVWVDGNGPTGQAQALAQAFRDAGQEGLDPADYDAATALSADAGSPDALAAAEVMLSATVVRYASDLRRGRAAPDKPDRELRVTPKSFDPAQVLSGAATAGDPGAYLQTLTPSDPFYRGLRQSLDAYRAIAATGGWPILPDGETLQSGVSDPRVSILRLRLQLTHDLAADSRPRSPDQYDDEVRQAVARFQQRHGIAADGVVGTRTREALNVPVQARIRQVLLNLERARWLPDELGDPYVLVNMAAFELEVVQSGQPALQMRVVVGRPARSTPMFSDEITYLELNPYWHVPRTILKEDKLPILRSNPGLLSAQGIRVITPGGARLDPTAIDWSTVSVSNFPYTLRQDPGARNALGRIKFMFPNPYDIYLHDTPSRGLFKRPMRAYSSGCIRIEKPIDLAEFLLRGNGNWPRERIERAIAAGRNRSVALTQSVPVHLVYLTAWLDRHGRVQFREDLYNRDGRVVATFDAARP
jgi:L,D-transpeptidase YcbB